MIEDLGAPASPSGSREPSPSVSAADAASIPSAGWQPIATAPRDGGYIIAGRFGKSNELLWVKHSRWMTAPEIAETWGGDPSEYSPGWTNGESEDDPCYPSHWMPLLPPPDASAIAARSGETRSGSTEGKSAAPEGGDAQSTPGDHP